MTLQRSWTSSGTYGNVGNRRELYLTAVIEVKKGCILRAELVDNLCQIKRMTER